MPLSKARNRERMRQVRAELGCTSIGYCYACNHYGMVDKHHIDHNHNNNGEGNVVLLCPNCHAEIHRGGKTLESIISRLHVQPIIAGLEMDGNRIVGFTKKAVQPTKTIPIYNPNKQYAPGDKVMVKPMYGKSKKLVEVTIPSIDADGNFIPDY